MVADVVLVTGPGGAGKSTLAANLGIRLDRTVFSEDEVWVARGWGHGLRTPEQEGVVQAEVLDRIAAVRTAVVEFILYKPAPNPLTAYEEGIAALGLTVASVLLRPDADEALERMIGRGRDNDLAALDRRPAEIEHQLRMVELAAPGRLVVDPTGLTAAETGDAVLRMLGA